MNRTQVAIKFLVIIFIFLGQFSLVGFNHDNSDCNYWAPQDWDNYLNDIISDTEKSYLVREHIASKKNQCPTNVAKNNIDRCVDRPIGFFNQKSFITVGDFSLIMSDEEYLASEPQDVMQLPQELKNEPNGLPQNWREIAKKNNWKYVLFQSGIGEARLAMYLPGENYDRMLLFYDTDFTNSDPTHYQAMQMQAIEKLRDGQVPEHSKVYFRSWNFIGENKKPELHSTSGRCISCHASGPRAIYVPDKPAFQTELGGVKNIGQFNDLIVYDGTIDMRPYYNLKYFPHDVKLGKEYCIRCHNGKDRSSLMFSASRGSEFFNDTIVKKVLEEESMPDDTYVSFTTDDRRKIVEDLSKEYFSGLKSWLTEIKCSGARTK